MYKALSSATARRFSAGTRANTRNVAESRQISRPDAEVLITYVVGIHCPDVR